MVLHNILVAFMIGIISIAIFYLINFHPIFASSQECKGTKEFDTCFYVEYERAESSDEIILRRINDDKLLRVKLHGVEIPSNSEIQNVFLRRFDDLISGTSRIRFKTKNSFLENGIVPGILYKGRSNVNKKLISEGYSCPTLGSGNSDGTSAAGDQGQLKLGVTLKRVVDGDTVHVFVAGTNNVLKIRMVGIDTPETKQEGGPQAKEHLEQLLSGRKEGLILEREAQLDKYGRTLGIIIKDGVDINEKMVIDGYAWCYRYTQCPKQYQIDMANAQKNKKGIFKNGIPENPWDWRKNQRNRN